MCNNIYNTTYLKRFFKYFTANLEPKVRRHLSRVYITSTLGAVTAAVGGYVYMLGVFVGAELLTAFCATGALLWLFFLASKKNYNQFSKLLLFEIFAFFTGCILGPLLNVAVEINPALITEAFLGASVVFACFSLSALFAPRGQYLYLGGILSSILSILLVMSAINILSDLVRVYVGLFITCGFILFDTQNIIEKVKSNDEDYVVHAVDLFLDFITLYIYSLIIYL